MSTAPPSVDNAQYDHIVDTYSVLYPPTGECPADFPLGAIETHQVYLAVTDPAIDIRGKRVLDLACGMGFYATKLLAWGAASVTGMDISAGMLAAARRSAQAQGVAEARLRFVQGDATDDHLIVDGAPFDLVTGCWLLNYAPDKAVMTKMYSFIARNLRPGGHWVGMVPLPLLSGEPHEAEMLNTAMADHGAWGRYGQSGRVLKTMPNGDGYLIQVELGTEAHKTKVIFECYMLTLKVLEQACKDSGVFEGLECKNFVIPEHVKAAYETGYWNALCLQPSCIMVTARKSS